MDFTEGVRAEVTSRYLLQCCYRDWQPAAFCYW